MEDRDEDVHLLWEAIPERCRPCDRARFMFVTQRINLLRGNVTIEELQQAIPRSFDDCPTGAMPYLDDPQGTECGSGANIWMN